MRSGRCSHPRHTLTPTRFADTARCLVSKILPDGTRLRARLFNGFLSHYVLRDRYGRPGKGNE